MTRRTPAPLREVLDPTFEPAQVVAALFTLKVAYAFAVRHEPVGSPPT